MKHLDCKLGSRQKIKQGFSCNFQAVLVQDAPSTAWYLVLIFPYPYLALKLLAKPPFGTIH